MTRFLVFEPGEGASAEAVFVADRFRWRAFLLPVVWLLWHRLFLAAILVALAQFGLGLLGRIEGFGTASVLVGVVLAIAVGLEGPRLLARRLRRGPTREAAVVMAYDFAHAELLYYGRVAAPAPAIVQDRSPVAPPAPLSEKALPLFGWHSGRALLADGVR